MSRIDDKITRALLVSASIVLAACSSKSSDAGSACDRLIDYEIAQSTNCGGTVPPASALAAYKASLHASCTGQIALPGSGLTVAVVNSCLDQLSTACHTNAAPAGCYNPPGTLDIGQPCQASTQCKSTRCNLTGSGCGTCAATAAVGEACDSSTGVYCVSGATCPSGKGTCVAYGSVDTGGTCSGDSECKNGLFCQTGKCAAVGAAGAACTSDSACTGDMFCVNGKCGPLLAVGADCSMAPFACSSGNGCDPSTKKCTAITFANPGETCGATTYCITGGCHLTGTSATGKCPTVIADGQPCNTADSTQTCQRLSTCVAGTCTAPYTLTCK
jgi:Dickkopf N-terminal cysteine-rich region